MKNKKIVILIVLFIFDIGMLCAVDTVSAKKYKGKNSIALKIKDGKKKVKLKCKYDKELKQYIGYKKTSKRYQYSACISYSKTNHCQSGKKGWSTSVQKDDLKRKYGDGYKTGFGNNKYHPVTKIKVRTWA